MSLQQSGICTRNFRRSLHGLWRSDEEGPPVGVQPAIDRIICAEAAGLEMGLALPNSGSEALDFGPQVFRCSHPAHKSPCHCRHQSRPNIERAASHTCAANASSSRFHMRIQLAHKAKKPGPLVEQHGQSQMPFPGFGAQGPTSAHQRSLAWRGWRVGPAAYQVKLQTASQNFRTPACRTVASFCQQS